MRRFLSSLTLVIYTTLFVLTPFVNAQGAPTGDATSPPFELVVPTTAKTNEAFDVTVKALKPDGSINTAYVGSILFSVDANSGATIPSDLNDEASIPYTFTATDQGQHTFSRAFTFPKEATYEIVVVDYENFSENPENDVKKTIVITGSGGSTTTNATVTITDPVSQDTVNTSTVTVTGTTTPTRTVNFYLGTVKKDTITSGTNGDFSGTVSGLVDGPNTIKVEVMDETPKPIGDASVVVNYSVDAPTITSLIAKEGTEIFAGSMIHLEATGDNNLKTVTVQFGDKDVVLVPDVNRPGMYSGTTQVSSYEGEVKLVVNVESFQGTKASFPNLLSLNIISSSFENVKVEATPDKKVQFTFALKSDLEEIKYFKIKYGTQSGKYDNEVITYEKTSIKQGEGYSWYIPGIDQGEYFSTIIALDKDKRELSVTSGEQTFSRLDSAETCYIDKVSGVTVKKSGSKSIISWDKLDDAASYQIFKKDADGEYAMIDEVTATSYKIHIDMTLEEDVFEDFQIRATCKNGDISGEGAYSESVSVQTGPAAIAFMMLLIASGVSFILMKRGYLR